MNAILYVTHNGVVWRALPADFPPWKSVYGFFERWKKKGVTTSVHDSLRATVRHTEGRAAQPTAGVIDSQSAKGAPTVTAVTRSYDAGKKVNGRKRFIVVDTLSPLLTVLVVPAIRRSGPDSPGCLGPTSRQHRSPVTTDTAATRPAS
ncbi:transposase IS4 family protein [Candidatus Protofrankia californiensis]|uniref:Transposase IS4 family protein n=1 Tax=Candidatus Protofrankia californiensis TaxID=1839754 RepID=A0A1C3NTM4_9ACTN|nr:transposase IS4 family protein [Candidatus Protofrankia californiensis]